MSKIEGSYNYRKNLLKLRSGIKVSKKSIEALLGVCNKQILLNDDSVSIKKIYVSQHKESDRKVRLLAQQLENYDTHIKIIESPDWSFNNPKHVTHTQYFEQTLGELLSFYEFIKLKLNEEQVSKMIDELNAEKGFDAI